MIGKTFDEMKGHFITLYTFTHLLIIPRDFGRDYPNLPK